MHSVRDQKLEILSISQFTLYSNLNKGKKPDFHHAMGGEGAKNLYNQFLQKLGEDYEPAKIKDGVFGAMMEVTIQNSGPVTIEIESPKKEDVEPKAHQ
jgi:D-tyrosyl-tRNA(Tyr) deacylase